MLHTKEFYEAMNHFEKCAKKNIRTGSQGFSREDKEVWVKQRYYLDGNVNDFFIIFLIGYSLGKTQ